MSLNPMLHSLAFDPLLARLLSRSSEEDLVALASWIATEDPYGECSAVDRALALARARRADAGGHFEHLLWCAWREAAWSAGAGEPLPVRVTGEQWVRETDGHPTVLVTPMTLATVDAMHTLASVNPGRPYAVFGEDVDDRSRDPLLELVDGDVANPADRIRGVLDGGGVLATYGDFVYEGRSTQTMPLFGTRRPVSTGFLSLAARPGTMLLPLICLRERAQVHVRVHEPLLVEASDGRAEETGTLAAAAEVIGHLLEALIAIAPEQWRLLATLTFDTPQMPAGGESSVPDAGAVR